MRILICDDEPIFIQELFNTVKAVAVRLGTDVQMRCCKSADEFIHMAEDLNPELVFMDLKLGSEDGYNVISSCRKAGARFEIAFITNYPERMPEAFPYRPIGFLGKPISEVAIAEILNRYLFYSGTETVYMYETRGESLRIPIAEIRYIESKQHHILLHVESRSEPLVQAKRLDDIEKELESIYSRFVRAHKSFLVNLDHIASIDTVNSELVLNSGERVPISRKNYHSTINRFINYQLR